MQEHNINTKVFALMPARVHEAAGPAAVAFAAIQVSLNQARAQPAQAVARCALWIEGARASTAQAKSALCPQGLRDFTDPDGLVMIHPRDDTDILAAAEDALRSGSVSTVVLRPERPVSLVQGKRLQLAAEQGNSTGICLIDSSFGAGSPAAQTRWHCAQRQVFGNEASGKIYDVPIQGVDSPRLTEHKWNIVKNKSGTIGGWHVVWDREKRTLYSAATAGE